MIGTLYAPAYFTGNNSTGTAYVCPWKALDADNLRVIATDADGNESSVLSNGSGITASLVGDTVEFTTDTAYDNTYTVTAWLTSDFLQSRDLQNSGNSDVNVRESMFDKLTLALQIALAGVSETSGLPISFPPSEEPVTQTLPTAPNRQLSFLYFDANGDLTTYALATLVSDIISLINTGDGDAADALANQVVTASASFTLKSSNAFRLHRCDASGGDITITVPQDSAQTIAVGTKWDIMLTSASGKVIFAEGSGATIESVAGTAPEITDQYGGATVEKVAADTYAIFGRLTS